MFLVYSWRHLLPALTYQIPFRIRFSGDGLVHVVIGLYDHDKALAPTTPRLTARPCR